MWRARFFSEAASIVTYFSMMILVFDGLRFISADDKSNLDIKLGECVNQP